MRWWILSSLSAVLLSAVLGACASPRETEPPAMSASAHEAVAAEHARAAAAHEAVESPPEVKERAGCSGRVLGVQVCWSASRTKPDEHAAQAEEHRRLAAEHRAASAALRQAEATSCAGVAAEDRDTSPFAHVDDIAGVEPLYEPTTVAKEPSSRLAGATILFRPVPGLTRERLQQIVDCHLARNAAMKPDVMSEPDCPLVLPGVRAAVEEVGDGLAVKIRSDDPGTAHEILRRSERLLGGAGRSSAAWTS